MPTTTYGQVTIDKDTWDRLNARIAELEAALERLWPWAMSYGETGDMTTAAQMASYQDDIDACRSVLSRK